MVAFVAKADATLTGSGSLSISKPTGTANGDLMVAAIAVSNGGITSAPAGWTQRFLFNGIHDVTNLGFGVWTKTASSEGSSYSWGTDGDVASGGIITLSSAVYQSIGADTFATGTSEQGNSVNALSNSDWLIHIGLSATQTSSATPTSTPPSGMTERVDRGAGFFFDPDPETPDDETSSAVHVDINTLALSSSGATGNKSSTLGYSLTNVGMLLLVSSGNQALTQTSKFNNSTDFNTHKVRRILKPAALSDSDTFYSPSVGATVATIFPPLYVDDDTFYAPVVTRGQPVQLASAVGVTVPPAPDKYDQANEQQLRNTLRRADTENFKRGRDVRLQQGERLIMKSANGTLYQIKVNDDGTLTTVAI
jgi:hypothetical protein